MSTAMERMRNAQPAGRRGATPPPPVLSEEARRQDTLANGQFEKQAAEFAKPTTKRPALIVESEIAALRTTYTLGAARLEMLRKVTDVRQAVWEEMQGEQPFDVPTPADRGKADAFFATHGIRLADAPRVAPPNPLKPPAATVPDPKGGLRPEPSPAPAPGPDSGGTARPAPAEIPGTQRGLVPMPPPASLKIEFLSEQGFRCELTLQAATATLVLEQGGGAITKLVQQKAKPVPATVVQPPAAGAPRAESNGEPPKCKYHGGVMKESKKPGTFFCPAKIKGTNDYCDYQVTV